MQLKIGTWNLQGNAWNATCSTIAEAKARMINQEFDVLCLQETGKMGIEGQTLFNDPNFQLITGVNIRTTYRKFLVNCYKYVFGDNNQRCSMAILVRSELDANCPAIQYSSGLRPVFGVLLTNNIAVYNIHAPSTGTIFSDNYDKSAIECICHNVFDYKLNGAIIAGDFNTTPDKLRTVLDPSIKIYAPSERNNI